MVMDDGMDDWQVRDEKMMVHVVVDSQMYRGAVH